MALVPALLLAGVSLGMGTATAAVLTVIDCGDTTPGGAPGQLRRLITDATPGDTILVPGCIIKLSGAANEDANVGGDLDIAKDLTIQGAGSHATVIDGGGIDPIFGGIDRIFDVFAPATVTLADLMIRNGRERAPLGQQGRGGGIRNAGTLTLNRVIVRDNGVTPADTGCFDLATGGGIANDGTLLLVDSAIEDNFAAACLSPGAGGVDNTGELTLTRSTVSRNRVSAAKLTALGTGGVQSSGTLVLVDSTVSSNAFAQIFNLGMMSAVGSAIVGDPLGPKVQFPSVGIASRGAATLANTIVANNEIQCSGPGTFASNGGNLTTDSTCGLSGENDAVAPNAGLGPLGVQGGPTLTHPLFPGSAAIDTALQAACSPTDQRGQARPAGHCDKGPVEFTPPLFADVAVDHFARGAIEALLVNGVTGGCRTAPLTFCPDNPVTRAQMAVFLVRVLHGPGFNPPPPTGIFADVPPSHPFAEWIEQLAHDGITAGCSTSPPQYCPDDPVTRAQTSVFILRTLAVSGFVPPPAHGIFSDVPASNLFAPWIEEFFKRGVTSGCQESPLAYCPADPATRAQVAVFLVRGFGFGF